VGTSARVAAHQRLGSSCFAAVEGRVVGISDGDTITDCLALRAYQHEQPTQERLVYRDKEDAAEAGSRGLWNYAKPALPWDWRRDH